MAVYGNVNVKYAPCKSVAQLHSAADYILGQKKEQLSSGVIKTKSELYNAFILMSCVGYDKPVLSGVMEGYAAEEAGLQEGDEIIQMNHFSVHFSREITAYGTFHSGETIKVTYARDGQKHTTTPTLARSPLPTRLPPPRMPMSPLLPRLVPAPPMRRTTATARMTSFSTPTPARLATLASRAWLWPRRSPAR